MSVRAIHGDMLEEIPRLVAEGVVCDACVCDPPYNLAAMAKRFGPGQKAATSPDHQRFAKGFMGMTWDSDIPFRPDTWATVSTILRPGAFLLAFGGTRTYHRLACAIEDAGFVIQDCIQFLFATGFPKRRDNLKPAYEPVIWAQKRFNASIDWDIISQFTIRIEALLWTEIGARFAENQEAEIGSSARWLAHALCASSCGKFARTDTFSLPETGLTCLSIGWLWNAILGVLSTNPSTFTTEMASSLTTGLRTLSYWISEITPESITEAAFRHDGLWPNAPTAETVSIGVRPNWTDIPTPSAREPATLSMASAILNTLADIAVSNSLLPRATVENFVRRPVQTDSTIRRDEYGSNADVLNVAPFLRLSRVEIRNIAGAPAWQPHTGIIANAQPIVLAYKPGGKRTMQIDECRIAADDGYVENSVTQGVNTARTSWEHRRQPRTFAPSQFGRWPANIAHDGSDEVVAMFPQQAGAAAPASGPTLRNGNTSVARGRYNGLPDDREPAFHGDSGSATRFFFNSRDGEASADLRYTKNGSTDFSMLPGERRHDTGSSARFFYSSKAGREDRFGSRHPTVKPVNLMKWLVALVTPPGGRLIDPFAGSGTTGIAALGTGRNAILIEREEQYYNDILERIAFYEGVGLHSTQAKARNRKVDLGPLFDAAEVQR